MIGLRLGQQRLLEYVRLTVLADLIRRDQIEKWQLPPQVLQWLQQNWGPQSGSEKTQDDVRAVLAELANPAFSFRTAAGIAARTHLD